MGFLLKVLLRLGGYYCQIVSCYFVGNCCGLGVEVYTKKERKIKANIFVPFIKWSDTDSEHNIRGCRFVVKTLFARTSSIILVCARCLQAGNPARGGFLPHFHSLPFYCAFDRV